MRHVFLLLVPFLMLAQYGTYVLGSRVRRQRYDVVFPSEAKQLSPSFEKRHRDAPLWNPRFYAITALMTVALYFLANREDLSAYAFEVILGTAIGLNATLLGRNLSSLLTFRFMARHPECTTGHVQISKQYLLNISLFQLAPVLIPFLVLAGLTLNPFIVGAALGFTVYACINLSWIMRAGPPRSDHAPGEPALQDPE